MIEVRIVLGRERSAVADDHLWRQTSIAPGAIEAPPATLDSLPIAERYFVIVPPERAHLYCLTLPLGARKKSLAALPYLLEDRLIEPIEHYEFIPLAGLYESGQLWMAVFERDWLSGVRSSLVRISRGEVRWVLAGWGWTDCKAGQTWCLQLDSEDETRILLSHGGPEVISLGAADLESELALVSASIEEAGPRSIMVDSGPCKVLRSRIDDWATKHDFSVVSADFPTPWQVDYAAVPWSFFQQNRSKVRLSLTQLMGFSAWRPTALILAALVLLELTALLAYWGALEHRVAEQRKKAVDVFVASAPAGAAVVDPVLQMRRIHQRRPHASGKAAPDDFLPMLAAVSKLLAPSMGSVQNMRYEGGRLSLTFDSTRPTLTAQLALGSAALKETRWQVKSTSSADQRQITLQINR